MLFWWQRHSVHFVVVWFYHILDFYSSFFLFFTKTQIPQWCDKRACSLIWKIFLSKDITPEAEVCRFYPRSIFVSLFATFFLHSHLSTASISGTSPEDCLVIFRDDISQWSSLPAQALRATGRYLLRLLPVFLIPHCKHSSSSFI